MNLLADESVDGPVVERLREDGHQVVYVAESIREFPIKKFCKLQTHGVPRY